MTGSLVHNSQSAFIKGRSIHDNFCLVYASTRLLHIHKKPTILFKTDISKAFDLVAWSLLLELLLHWDFPNAWINAARAVF
jgi:hypothetical protein